MKTFLPLLLLFLLACCVRHSHQDEASANLRAKVTGQEEVELTEAPAVPPIITRHHATKEIVKLETREIMGRLADGVKYQFWTFGDKVPGKFIRIREGDLVEFHLENHPDNKMPHDIDLHAVIGPGGGGASSITAPGHASVFSFKALYPGLYVYHCGIAPVAMHIANGMYGMIFVQPKHPLPKVDREFYIMQGEFYTKGKYGEPGIQTFSMKKAIDEKPEYVVFNGSVGALVGDHALHAKVGETIRLFVGNGGPNLTSSFHVIGEVFDRVWLWGNTTHPLTDVQTVSIPPGGTAIIDLKLRVPGTYTFVDHAVTRAFNRGALAQLRVSGPPNKLIYSGKIRDEIYLPEGSGIKVPAMPVQAQSPAVTKEERIERGGLIFHANCAACHQPNGQGIPSAFPPLAKSDFLNADKIRAIKTVTGGRHGKIVVNGHEFNGVMPAWSLSDEDIANVLTFIYNSWGNSGQVVTTKEVKVNRVKPK